jgi:8-oxo-dGTP pyrophosphatase MutT (NUDIX family)
MIGTQPQTEYSIVKDHGKIAGSSAPNMGMINNPNMTTSHTPQLVNEMATPTQFARHARRRLMPDALPPGTTPPVRETWSPGDFDLNRSATPPDSQIALLRPAAVLIPVIARDQLTVLLTRRSEHLAKHAGQIAFPGGKIEPSDANATAAALREANEEIGLGAHLITPLGFLDTYRTGTGFQIEPLVALVHPSFELTLDAQEVAEVFEVPLEFLMTPANHQTHTKIWQGSARQYYAMPYETHYIWGATAGILKNMHTRLFTP